MHTEIRVQPTAISGTYFGNLTEFGTAMNRQGEKS